MRGLDPFRAGCSISGGKPHFWIGRAEIEASHGRQPAGHQIAPKATMAADTTNAEMYEPDCWMSSPVSTGPKMPELLPTPFITPTQVPAASGPA